VISGAAFCPQPPALVPELAGAAALELAPVRAACGTAIRRVVAPDRQLVLLGSADVSRAHSPLSRGSLAGFGLPVELHLGAPTCGGALELPPSLTVGAWLVQSVLGPRSGARGFSVGPDFAGSRAAVELLELAETQDVALLVMGDGSARRGVGAPGYLEERAAPFDAAVAEALGAGDAAALEALDPDLGAELLAAGVSAWRAAGRLLDGRHYDAELLYSDDPYGVGYLVAAWTARG
jgi:hypothetical protein